MGVELSNVCLYKTSSSHFLIKILLLLVILRLNDYHKSQEGSWVKLLTLASTIERFDLNSQNLNPLGRMKISQS